MSRVLIAIIMSEYSGDMSTPIVMYTITRRTASVTCCAFRPCIAFCSPARASATSGFLVGSCCSPRLIPCGDATGVTLPLLLPLLPTLLLLLLWPPLKLWDPKLFCLMTVVI